MIKSSMIIAAAIAAFVAAPLQAGLPGFPLVPGEIIIRTANPKALAGALATLSAQYQNIAVMDQIAGRPVYLVSYGLSAGQDANTMHATLDAMTASGQLVWGELNYVGQTGEGNTDSLWLSGIGANANTFSDQYSVPMLGVNKAHFSSEGAGIVVSVIDTGIDAGHPVFNGMVSTQGASFVPGSAGWADIRQYADTDGDGMIDEQFGHGTFVAGLVHLVAPEAMILSARALDSNGHGNNFRIAQAVAWSIDRGAHVINMSLGETYHSMAMVDMVAEASLKGIIVCGAAGNRNTQDPREFPACDPNAFGVSAFDWNDQKAPFSNLEVRLDFAAPGDSDIVAGVPNMSRCVIGPVPGANYAIWEGTSFANAFVSGTVALVRAQRPDWPSATAPPPTVRNLVYDVLAVSGVPIIPSNPAWDGLLGVARISTSGAVLENPPAARRGDINADGVINGADLALVLTRWGTQPKIIREDLNADGAVNAQDLTILLSLW